MSVRHWIARTRKGPRGAWSALDQVIEGQPMRGFISNNVRFRPGECFSREGTSIRATVAGKVTSMYNWITSGFNRVLFTESGTAIRKVNVPDSVVSDLFTGLPAFRAMSVAEAGTRAYIALFDANCLGVTQARVTDGASANDVAFAPPLVFTSSSAVDSGPGLCTAGTHLIGFVCQSRTGFNGKPSPAPADVFTPISITLAAGKRTIQVQITLNTPASAGLDSAIYVIMTRADNANKWFYVPGVFAVLPPSTAGWVQNFPPISITDEDMANRAELADKQFDILSQTVGGTGPFNPSVVLAYRHRVVYIADNKAYISEIDDAQALSEDQHVKQTPGLKRIVTAFPYGQSLYLVGDKWLAQTADNGDLPVLWSQPQELSGIGTTAPLGVDWRTAGGYVWMACEDGLRLFRGTFDPIPITYLFEGWGNINWAAAYCIHVVDDIVNRKCYVAIPAGAATEPTHLITVDYTAGLAYDKVDISLDNFDFGLFSSICAVKEVASARTVLWLGPDEAGSILFLNEATHNDNGAAIQAVWESGYLRRQSGENDLPSHFIRVGNASLGVVGNGILNHTWYGVDRTMSVVPAALVLSATPGRDLFTKFDLHPTENFSLRIETNAVNHFFRLTGITAYMKPSLYNP